MHPRLRRLLNTEEVVTQYVYDHGKGSVRIADIGPAGLITWSQSLKGVEHGQTTAQPPTTNRVFHPLGSPKNAP